MSNTLKAIGVIIAIFGGLAYFASMYSMENDAATMPLSQYFSMPHFMKTMKAFIGELAVIAIGLIILIIGVKACRSPS